MYYLCNEIKHRGVAQLASAPRSGRGGRKFESSHPDKGKGTYIDKFLFLFFDWLKKNFISFYT